MRKCIFGLVLGLVFMAASVGWGQVWKPAQLWVYTPCNLLVNGQVDELEKVWRRAAAAGYTHVFLVDGKLARMEGLGAMTKTYAGNLARVKKLAGDLKLELVVGVAEFGYSEALLWHDPMLAEAVPVRGTLMEARGGIARVVADPAVGFGKPAFVDEGVKLVGKSATVENPTGNARMSYLVKASPFRCYHVSVEVETEGFTGEARIAVLDEKGRSLQYETLKVEKSQKRATVDVVFDSFEASTVRVYFGQWGAAKGKLVWRDWKIEEAGPVNVIRRKGAEVVLHAEGSIDVKEGVNVDRIEDPLCGTKPWSGSFDSWHEVPVIRTKLADGVRFRVDWWYPPVVHEGQVAICPGEEKTWEIVGKEMGDVGRALSPAGMFLGFDEIRVMGWDGACGGKSAGAELAEAARRAAKLARERGGAKTVYAWSDMFDPNHNAVKDYYLVKGDLSGGGGSWEGLDNEVVVVNWNFGKREASLKFFADRGHRQVIGAYYDGPMENSRKWIEAAGAVKGVEGMMYCTWRRDYSKLEEFAKVCGR